MGKATVTLTTLRHERLVVELRTGPQGSTHAQTALIVALPNLAAPNVWRFKSGLAEATRPGEVGPYIGYLESVRALYNATVKAYGGSR
jgi:hypothetical protein